MATSEEARTCGNPGPNLPKKQQREGDRDSSRDRERERETELELETTLHCSNLHFKLLMTKVIIA